MSSRTKVVWFPMDFFLKGDSWLKQTSYSHTKMTQNMKSMRTMPIWNSQMAQAFGKHRIAKMMDKMMVWGQSSRSAAWSPKEPSWQWDIPKGLFACRALIPAMTSGHGLRKEIWRWSSECLKLAGIYSFWDLHHLPSLTEHNLQVQKCRVGTDKSHLHTHTKHSNKPHFLRKSD